jgi:hypothetical protein
MDIKLLIPIIIEAAKAIIDGLVDGAKLNDWQQRVVRSAYFEVQNWYDLIIDDDLNTYTKAALDAFLALCEDTAQEGQFDL